jgi:hypothetical protein
LVSPFKRATDGPATHFIVFAANSSGRVPPGPEGRSTVNDDQRTRHSRIAVTWQIASEFVFSGLLEHDIPAGDPACLYLQTKTQGRNEKTVLRFGPAVVENQRTARPAAIRTVDGAYLNSVETILTSAGLVSFEGSSTATCACALVTDGIATAARLNATMKPNCKWRPDFFDSTIFLSHKFGG